MKNLSAVVLSAVAFFIPSVSFAQDFDAGQSGYGFRTSKVLSDMTDLWEPKDIAILNKDDGLYYKTRLTKMACILDRCFYRYQYLGIAGKKKDMQIIDLNEIERANKALKEGGNKPYSEMGREEQIEQDARDLGITKEQLKQMYKEDDEFARILREIEVKRAEQKKKEEEEKQKQGGKGNGSGGGGGSSGGGGGSSGGGGGSSGGGSSGGGGGSSGGGGGSSGGGGGSSGGGGGSSGGGGGSNGGGSNGHGSNGGGSNGGGGGSSGGGSNGGGSNGGGSKKRSYYKACYDGSCNYGDSEAAACSGAAKGGLRFLYEDGSCLGTNGKNKWLWGVSKVEWEVQKETGCKDGFNRVDTGKGSFSVVCNVKHGDTDFGGYSVGSLGGQNSSSSNNSNGLNSSGSSSGGGGGSSSKASGAGASAGGNGANDGGRAPSAGGGTAQNSSDSNKSDSSKTNANSGQDNSKMGGSDSGNKSDSSSGKSDGQKKADSDGNSGGSADGNGDGSGNEQYGLPDVPDVPDGGAEPDWNGIKSDGNFGTFSPSSAFATGGQCPQDILLDFGQFGRHSFSWSPICEAAQRLRYVFITLAYFMAAMMVYKTVNSLRG